MTPEQLEQWYKKRANDMMNSIPQDKTYKPDAKVMQDTHPNITYFDTQDKSAVLVGYIMVALVSGGLGVLFGMAV